MALTSSELLHETLFITVRFRAGRLGLDDVVNLEHLRIAYELDPNIGQYRHQTLTERVELLPRIPRFRRLGSCHPN